MAAALHTSYNLYVSSSAYTFEPVVHSPSEPVETLVIDRRTGAISLNPRVRVPLEDEKVITVYGIMGILSLTTADFLILITNRARHGRLIGSEIYLATSFRILPIPCTPSHTPQALLAHPVESRLLALVKRHLDEGRFWFSYGWDLTRSVQAQWAEQGEGGKEEGKEGMWRRCEERYWWNRYLCEPLIAVTESGQDLSRFILPVIYGTFDIRLAHIRSRPFLFCLISRRSRHAAGTRYFSRGLSLSSTTHSSHPFSSNSAADDNPAADPANFVESEQIVLLDPEGVNLGGGRIEGRERLSFVQTRGSTPIFWAEVNNLRYRPDLQIMEIPDTVGALRKHLESLRATYGAVYLVNLVNSSGHEQPVKEAYEKYVALAGVEGVRYEYFDFHRECRGMRWERIQGLIDRLEPVLREKGWFHQTLGSAEPRRTQRMVVRSNCMDCLDRTNVVQSALAKWVLTQQLKSVGVLGKEGERLEDWEEFMSVFREVWADHADLISLSYAGTGALKTDFTRTGRRTRLGALQDVQNSALRYIKNNFLDGPRQDAYDLFTGAWRARRGGGVGSGGGGAGGGWGVRVAPWVAGIEVGMMGAALVLPRSATSLPITTLLVLLVLLLVPTIYFILANGTAYVAWPRLNPPLETLYYDGPGFREPQRGRGKLGFSLRVGEHQRAGAGEYQRAQGGRDGGDKEKEKEKGGTGTGRKWGLGGLRMPVGVGGGGGKVEEVEMGGKKRVD